MKVLWRSDMGQGKHDPLEITHVVTKSGSQVSADLIVLAVDHLGSSWAKVGEVEQFAPSTDGDETAGLMEVIDAQMVAIDDLTKQRDAYAREMLTLADPDDVEQDVKDLRAWADQFPDLVEDLCMALGFARNPIAPTGIPELDIIVKLAR